MPATFICKGCGKEARVLVNGTTRRNFCSVECRKHWEATHGRGPNTKQALVTYVCEQCGKSGIAKTKGGKPQRFCSLECQREWVKAHRTTGVQRQCLHCGKTFYAKPSEDKANGGAGKRFCSRACSYAGRKHRDYAHVRIHPAGYRQIWMPGHPRASDGYVFEHILVAEAKLGRPIGREEAVHHINGDRLDNRSENLDVMSHAEHARLHHQQRKE